MPRYGRALGALFTGLAILVFGTASAFAVSPAPHPEPPHPQEPATAGQTHRSAAFVKRGRNGQVDVTIYTPAPSVSVEELVRRLTAVDFQGVVTTSDQAAQPAANTPAASSAASSDACSHGAARTSQCPSVHWANSGFADPQVRFINSAGPEWPVQAAVQEWNRAVGIDSSYHAQQKCSFPSGNHCVSVQDGNYGATGWVGRTAYSYNTRTRNFVENSVSVTLNDYYALNADGRRQTACHELGHALGLGHNVRDLGCLWHKTTNNGHRVPDNDDFGMLASIYSVVR